MGCRALGLFACRTLHVVLGMHATIVPRSVRFRVNYCVRDAVSRVIWCNCAQDRLLTPATTHVVMRYLNTSLHNHIMTKPRRTGLWLPPGDLRLILSALCDPGARQLDMARMRGVGQPMIHLLLRGLRALPVRRLIVLSNKAELFGAVLERHRRGRHLEVDASFDDALVRLEAARALIQKYLPRR